MPHGWHSGLVLPRHSLTGEGAGTALRNLATRFRAYDALEFGWGEARFYRATPTLAAFDWRLALSALFTPGGSDGVIQVVGLARPARASFPQADIVPVPLSRKGLARLLAHGGAPPPSGCRRCCTRNAHAPRRTGSGRRAPGRERPAGHR
jgi:hypothetical protein